jgi:hypothetical protein
MPDGKRLWRTEEGDLVEDGHPEARVLAYGTDDALAEGEKVRSAKRPEKVAAKATSKQQDK